MTLAINTSISTWRRRQLPALVERMVAEATPAPLSNHERKRQAWHKKQRSRPLPAWRKSNQ